MIKVVFFDIDGTLLDGNKGIPKSSIVALGKLREKGIKTVICTGRGYSEIRPLNLKDFDAYILLNGQICFDDTGEIIFENELSKKTKDKLIKFFNEKKFPFGLCTAKRSYLNYVNENIIAVHDSLNCPVPEVDIYRGEKIYQALSYGNIELRKYLEKELEECSLTSWNGDGMDIVAKGSSKASGVKRYIEKFGIDLKDTMAFGDGENDIDMLKYVDKGICMGNGLDSVKEIADYVTDRIDEDGLYNALVHFGVIKKEV